MAENEFGRHKKVTLAEIANAAGVSKATVSLVLNDRPGGVPISEETRRRVLAAAALLHYKPNAAARALATGRSCTVLMVAFDLWDENLTERLRGAESRLVPAGYSTRICTVDAQHGAASCEQILNTGQADGMLLTGLATPETYPLLHELKRVAESVHVPVVALADAFPHETVDAVAHIDDFSGAYQAITHLIEHGHKRIALLGVANQRWAQNREHGYRQAIQDAGIPVDPGLILLGDRSQRWAYEAANELAKSTDFTAMFAMTDNMAIAAMSALKSTGRQAPDDYAIIGFDDNEKIARYTDPPLTTVDNPFYDAGVTAATMLVALIEGNSFDSQPLPTRLVIRRSCGCVD